MTSDNLKKALGDALLRLMQEKSFDEIRISDISAEADVSRRSFYRFYHNKEALLTDLITNSFSSSFDRHLITNGFEALYPITETIEAKADSYRYVLASKSGRSILTDTLTRVLHPYAAASLREHSITQEPAFVNTAIRHCCGILVDLIADWLDGIAPASVSDAKSFADYILEATAKTTAIFGQIAAQSLELRNANQIA